MAPSAVQSPPSSCSNAPLRPAARLVDLLAGNRLAEIDEGVDRRLVARPIGNGVEAQRRFRQQGRPAAEAGIGVRRPGEAALQAGQHGEVCRRAGRAGRKGCRRSASPAPRSARRARRADRPRSPSRSRCRRSAREPCRWCSGSSSSLVVVFGLAVGLLLFCGQPFGGRFRCGAGLLAGRGALGRRRRGRGSGRLVVPMSSLFSKIDFCLAAAASGVSDSSGVSALSSGVAPALAGA